MMKLWVFEGYKAYFQTAPVCRFPWA